MKRIGQIFGLALALSILWVSTSRASQINRFLDMICYPQETSFTVEMSANIQKWPLYSDTRLEKLNRILRHFSFRGISEKETTEGILFSDGEAALSWEKTSSSDSEYFRFSVNPEIQYSQQKTEGTISLFDNGEEQLSQIEHYCRIYQWVQSYYGYFEKITTLFPNETAVSAMQMKYKEFHTAVQKNTLILNEEQMLDLQDHPERLFSDRDQEASLFFSKLVFHGKQKITIQKDEDGSLVRVNYTGKTGLDENQLRDINIDWKICRESEKEIDQIQIKTPSVKGTARDNLTFRRDSVLLEDGTEKWTVNMEEDLVEGKTRTVIKTNAELNWNQEGIKGSFQEKKSSAGQNTETDLQCDIKNENKQQWKGILEITKKTGKIETTRYTLDFFLKTENKEQREPAYKEQAQEVRPVTDEEMNALEYLIAEAILGKVMSFPEEDLLFLSEDIPDNLWESLTGK